MLEKSFHLKNCQIMASNIAYQLKLKGKTRKEACEELGFAYSTFTEWLNGKSYPRIDKIEKMADYFHCEKSELIECRNEKALQEKEVFAMNLKAIMLSKDLTQKEIAKIANVSAPTVNEWLKAKKYPRIDKIAKLADYFNISKADLIEDKSNVLNSASEGENKSNPAKSKNILLCYLFGAKVNKNRQDGLMEKINISAAMGQIIRQHREQKGMTQKDLAQLLGVSKSTVGKWETGAVRNLKVEVMHHVSKVLDIEPMSLSGIAGADNYHQRIIASMFDFSKEEFNQVCDFIQYIKSKRK